jgi:pimeloyl-ACP methyl ester carboxylesterase
MRKLFQAAADPRQAAARIIWLPGAYNTAADFDAAGFTQVLHAARADVELEFVDLELEYLGSGAALPSLRAQCVLPALAAGRRTWLAGISLGGMIALRYAASYASDLAGICVFAPYLGNRMLIADIGRTGGLQGWHAGALAPDDDERRIWHFIQTRGHNPPLHLGYGSGDRFAAADPLVAGAPAPAPGDIDGGHDWPTWTRLWERFLTSNAHA